MFCPWKIAAKKLPRSISGEFGYLISNLCFGVCFFLFGIYDGRKAKGKQTEDDGRKYPVQTHVIQGQVFHCRYLECAQDARADCAQRRAAAGPDRTRGPVALQHGIASGISAADGGAGFLFMTLSSIFNNMGGVGRIVGTLFFLFMIFAAYSTVIAVFENIMSFWLEKDVWDYLRKYQVPYCKIYDMGYERTGCVFCMFGAHLDAEPTRFQRLQKTHPKLWRYCMKDWETGGLGMRPVLEYIGIPYENYQRE